MYQDELYHYGVKGMKWGVRKNIAPMDGSYPSSIHKKVGIDRVAKDVAYVRKKNKAKRVDTVTKAADRAKKFRDYANDNVEQYKKQQKSNKSPYANKKDYDRWIKASENQARKYDQLYKKYRDMPLKHIDKKTYKEAKKFINKCFVDAEYADYYYKGQYMNYLID